MVTLHEEEKAAICFSCICLFIGHVLLSSVFSLPLGVRLAVACDCVNPSTYILTFLLGAQVSFVFCRALDRIILLCVVRLRGGVETSLYRIQNIKRL